MKRRLKLALFTDTFDETNGVARTYQMLARFAEANGRELDVYAPGPEDSIEQRGSVGICRFRAHLAFEYYDQLKFSLLPNRQVFETFRRRGPYSLVHVAAPGSLGSWGRGLARRSRLPLVGVHHTNLHDYAAVRVPKLFSGSAREISLEILRRFYRPCQTVLATTPGMAKVVKELGIGRQTDVFSRGVDCHRFHPGHRDLPVGGPVRLICVGRVAIEKNLLVLAAILNRLRGRVDFQMTFVGDGPLMAELKKQCPWAEYPGILRGEDLSRAYANADLFVFPSLTDTYGNVVNEAHASGLPCVVMDPNGPGEVIEPGSTGLLGESEAEFEAAVLSLIQDPVRRAEMGIRARRLAESRDWDQIFQNLWGLYDRVAQGA